MAKNYHSSGSDFMTNIVNIQRQKMRDEQQLAIIRAEEQAQRKAKLSVTQKYGGYNGLPRQLHIETEKYIHKISIDIMEAVRQVLPQAVDHNGVITQFCQAKLKDDIMKLDGLHTKRILLTNSVIPHIEEIKAYHGKIKACQNLQQADLIANELTKNHDVWILQTNNGIKSASEDMIEKIRQFYGIMTTNPPKLESMTKEELINFVRQEKEKHEKEEKQHQEEQRNGEYKTKLINYWRGKAVEAGVDDVVDLAGLGIPDDFIL